MRSSVYLFATAILAATSTPAFATEMALGDSAIAVYGDSYAGTAHDAAYGNPYGESYISSEEVIFVEETAPVEILSMEAAPMDAPIMEASLVEAEYIAAPSDILAYSAEPVDSIYSTDSIEDAPISMTETIDGIVYETVTDPTQTY